MIKRLIIFLLISICCITQCWAEGSFTVQKIQIVGLQRISRGTVLSYLPIRVGDTVHPEDTSRIIQALYQTNFFRDISLLREGDTLVVSVVERPTIGALHIKGNKKIPTKQLVSALTQLGFTEGQVFDQSVLIELKQALLQQYYNLGRYNARVTVKVTMASQNRAVVNIDIVEGAVAKIKAIKILGNHTYTQQQLLHNFTLSTPSLWTFFSGADQYSKFKLDGDLEKLRSYYLDRGFLKFKIDSTQVSITPDRRHVYITLHIIEGPVYHISGFDVSGQLLGKKAKFVKLVDLKNGQVFSRQQIIDITRKFTDYLGSMGYAFPRINPIPQLDDSSHLVFINFQVYPGKKVYIRRINFEGNSVTSENVFRREMRQYEGGLYNLPKINESKRNIQNLAFVQNVDMQLKPVPGHPNQADMVYNIKETSASAISANVSYSDAGGFGYGASINDGNFLGEGKTVGFAFNGNAYQKSYSFNYYNPYFTTNNVGFGYSIYYNYTTPGAVNLSSYTTNTVGFSFKWSYPISEYSSLYFGGGYEHTRLKLSDNSPIVASNFVNQHGSRFDEYTVSTGWNYNSLDRYLYPTRGFNHGIDLTVAIPLGKSSLEYYKAQYYAGWYQPLVADFIMHLSGAVGYGNGYGRYNKQLPFFENYFAGGIGTVRGFEANTLGPRDPKTGDSLGGNIKTVGTVALIFPNPFGDTVRTSAFVDIGNVYDSSKEISLNSLRSAAGMQLEWRTPIAPLVFSLATPLHRKTGDDTQVFQFSISTGF